MAIWMSQAAFLDYLVGTVPIELQVCDVGLVSLLDEDSLDERNCHKIYSNAQAQHVWSK